MDDTRRQQARKIGARQSQIGVIGDYGHTEGSIHFHGLTAPQSLRQIPEATCSIKGRGKELDELTAAIREDGITISGVRGMGDIGKTELALKLAQQVAPDYTDAQLFIELNDTWPSPMRLEQAMGWPTSSTPSTPGLSSRRLKVN
jgi:hypothetical protein